MLFPTHVLAGYVVGYERRLPPVPAAAGAALPDLIDKPLAILGIIEIYHSVGHSALVLSAALPVVLFGRAWLAVWLGWASHLVLDVAHMVVNARPGDAVFLLWPVVVRESSLGLAPVSFVDHYLWTPGFFLEFPIWIAFGYVVRRQYAAGDPPMPGS
ncbi:metal-dependent hydrolase [Halopenitus persicus]|uniref:metal-dependent hydrolase n=1 Tax=Halopenitus persicus TaxID=1048396 RepID=UPI000BBADCBE|nr:metal-dependent hydrolase [Halopenitus persicus]